MPILSLTPMRLPAAPDAVKPAAFTGATLFADILTIALPAKSVVVLRLE
jgi:hypothetical protein